MPALKEIGLFASRCPFASTPRVRPRALKCAAAPTLRRQGDNLPAETPSEASRHFASQEPENPMSTLHLASPVAHRAVTDPSIPRRKGTESRVKPGIRFEVANGKLRGDSAALAGDGSGIRLK